MANVGVKVRTGPAGAWPTLLTRSCTSTGPLLASTGCRTLSGAVARAVVKFWTAAAAPAGKKTDTFRVSGKTCDEGEATGLELLDGEGLAPDAGTGMAFATRGEKGDAVMMGEAVTLLRNPLGLNGGDNRTAV